MLTVHTDLLTVVSNKDHRPIYNRKSITGITLDSVATYLWCGGIFSDSIITNILLILTVKTV